MAFAHLHVHTEYSLLDGSNKIKEYVRRVKELGMTAAAITDHGVMYGCVDFWKAATEEGIKPIIGCEVYVAPGSRFDKEANAGDERYHHLILLAENNKGYENLCKIVSIGFTEGFYYRPRVDFEILEQYREGIIVCSACLAGELARLLTKGDMDGARACAEKYLNCFGRDHYYLELQDHGYPDQRTVNSGLLTLSRELGIDLVATNDVHYTYAEDAKPHEILLCLQTGKTMKDENRLRYEGGQFYVKSEQEMRALFPYALEAIENTQKIADRCNVEFDKSRKLPHYETPEGYSSFEYLKKLCDDGLKERYGSDAESHRERLDYELSVISNMGFTDYFLIVWDFINYAKRNDIPVGPGRGSAAGSIVAYCLRITDIDPIRFSLLFERFLNPERVSMPDIDVDFCYERRQEVIDYVRRKYGEEKVVQIITFGTLAARGVIRDVARALDMPYQRADQIAKMVPTELNITLDKALSMNPEFRSLYETDPEVHYLIDMCKRLEGLPRHTSMHAAGVLICPKAADEFVPLQRGADGSITTQYVMTTLEELGLLKMDFLGLRTLTVIKDALRLAELSTGRHIDINDIDYADPEVLNLMGSGRTEGVFQLESAGMKNFFKELKPKSLEDVTAGISLYRPGPMDFIPQYIEGKEHPEEVTYLTPELKPILEATYGCIVYQEQVMQIVRDLGGYTLGRSDLVRRAMSKKKAHVMEVERNNFIYGNPEEKVPGCVSKGISEKVAGEIYEKMMTFAQYAFNKSHAACYAVVSYQTAFLKRYYPVEYMAALMTSFIENASKVSEYINVCRAMGITILPPDVNNGEAAFTVRDGKICYALTAIKSVGRPIIDALVRERELNGPFKNLTDLAGRMAPFDFNKRAMEHFIKGGALDSLGGTRKQYMSVYMRVMDNISNGRKQVSGQISLMDFMQDGAAEEFKESLPNVGEYDRETMLAFEKEVLGIYVSGHPLDDYRTLLSKNTNATAADFMLDPESETVKIEDGKRVVIGGMITAKTVKYTKTNRAMAFLTLEDLYGTVEVIVFPNDYDRYGRSLDQDAKVIIEGKTSVEEDKEGKLILEKLTPFDEIPKEVWIRFPDRAAYEARAGRLEELIKGIPGRDSVVVYLEDVKKMLRLPAGFMDAGEAETEMLRREFGAENIGIVQTSLLSRTGGNRYGRKS